MNASDKLPRSGYIQTIYEYLLGLIKKLDANTQSLRSRMNALTALANSGGVPAGTIEAEVTDARVDSSGQVYANLGEAVRGQITELNDTINDEVETLSNNQGNFLIFSSTNPNSKYQIQFQKINGKPTLVYSIKEDEE